MEVSHATGNDRICLKQLARQDWFPDYDEDEMSNDPWERWKEDGVMWRRFTDSLLVYQDLGSVCGIRLLKINHALGKSEDRNLVLLDTMASALDRCHEKVLLVDANVDEDIGAMTSLTPVRGWPGGHLCTAQKEPTSNSPDGFRTLIRIGVGDLHGVQWDEALIQIRLDGTHLEIELPVRAYAVRNDAPMGNWLSLQWRGWSLLSGSDVRIRELVSICDGEPGPWNSFTPTGEDLYDRYHYTYIVDDRRSHVCVCLLRLGRLPMRDSGSSTIRAEMESMRHAWGFIYARACSAARVIQRLWRKYLCNPQFKLARRRLMREYEALLCQADVTQGAHQSASM